MSNEIHPVTLEVVRNGIYAIAEEMSAIVKRSARSPLLREAGDLSSALTDASGRLIAQGKDIPIHLGVMGFTVKALLGVVAPGELRDGDHWVLNLPEVGGNHLPDVKLVRPVFAEGRLVAFAITLAHWADIGGAVPGSYVPWATEAVQEGLRIPPVRIFDRDGRVGRTWDFLFANVRGRTEREGDLLAQYAANEAAARRLGEMFARYGTDTVLDCFERYQTESAARMREAIRSIPDGVYVGEDFLDDDGVDDARIPVRVTITIDGERACFDFTGTAAQCRGPLNTTACVTHSSVWYALKALAGADIPPNDGCYRVVEVIVPSGTVVNASPEAPVVGGNHETAFRIVDAIFRALAPALPGRVTAGASSTTGILLFGGHARGRAFVLYECHGGGEGASAGRDGDSIVRTHMGNTANTPAEVIEAEYPLQVLHQGLREGSAGAGAHRGGYGQVRRYRVLAEATLTTMVERIIGKPWGAFGGADGLPFRITLERDGAEREVRGKETLALRAGDVVTIESAGGGGYGPPAERPDAAVARDRERGYV